MRDLARTTSALAEVGYQLMAASEGTMDSGHADYESGGARVRVLKDRSQWMPDGERTGLEPAGLWRAFDSTDEFIDALLTHIVQKT